MTHEIDINQTASAGAWSFNTQKFTENVYLEQIIVKSVSSGTTFNFYILDSKSNYIFDTRDDTPATGLLRREVNIPLKGIHTIGVIDSSANEAYTGKLVWSEKPW